MGTAFDSNRFEHCSFMRCGRFGGQSIDPMGASDLLEVEAGSLFGRAFRHCNGYGHFFWVLWDWGSGLASHSGIRRNEHDLGDLGGVERVAWRQCKNPKSLETPAQEGQQANPLCVQGRVRNVGNDPLN